MEQSLRNVQTKRQIKLEKFVNYQLKQLQNSSESCSQTNDEETKSDKFVEFCVNIDIGSWKPQIEQLSKVPDPFMPLGS